MEDMVRHGRSNRGTKNPNTNMTQEQALQIKRLRLEGKIYRDSKVCSAGKFAGSNVTFIMKEPRGWLHYEHIDSCREPIDRPHEFTLCSKNKSEKEETRVQAQERPKPKNERHGGQELNVMGYVTGSQNKDDRSDDSEKGYEIIDGNIHTTIRMVGNRGGRHRGMLRNTANP
jgi:hypothetical protein